MSDVNFIKHALAFHRHIPENEELTPFHISLYYALFFEWNDARFDTEFRIVRNDIMDFARIGSANTYRQCLFELNRWNYLDYLPSQSKYRPSTIRMHRFDIADPSTILKLPHHTEVKRDPGAGAGTDPHAIKSDRGSDAAADRPVRPYNTNTINPSNTTKQTGEKDPPPTPGEPVEIIPLPPAAEKKEATRGAARIPNNLNEVEVFFASEQSTMREAKKFYYHYKANGWKMGRNPMDDWQAAAVLWIMDPNRFAAGKTPTPGSLQTPGPRGEKKKYGPL